MELLHLSIVSPEKELFNGYVKSVELPGASGAFMILPRHAPIVSSLCAGKLKYVKDDGEKEVLNIQSGFIEMSNNSVIVCLA